MTRLSDPATPHVLAPDILAAHRVCPVPPTALPRVVYALSMEPGYKFGSIEDQILALAARFRAEGSLFLPLFLCDAAAGALDFFHRRGVAAEALDLRRLRWSGLRALARLVRRHRIDAIHWNFTSPLSNAYLWGLTLLRPGLRHYFTDHVSRPLPLPPVARGPRRWLKGWLSRRYARVFAVSRFVADRLAAEGVRADRITCALHFVDTDRFRPDAATRARVRHELGADGQFIALVVGQLIDAKGIDVALAAAARLPASAAMWVIGDGPARAALAAAVASQGLTGRVRLLGHRFDVSPYMKAADCFVCPSRWAEAAGLVNLEAAACGLPVLASRVGGIPEYLDDGRTGWLFDPGDGGALADRLCSLSADPALVRRAGDAARALVVARFSTAARLDEFANAYRS